MRNATSYESVWFFVDANQCLAKGQTLLPGHRLDVVCGALPDIGLETPVCASPVDALLGASGTTAVLCVADASRLDNELRLLDGELVVERAIPAASMLRMFSCREAGLALQCLENPEPSRHDDASARVAWMDGLLSGEAMDAAVLEAAAVDASLVKCPTCAGTWATAADSAYRIAIARTGEAPLDGRDSEATAAWFTDWNHAVTAERDRQAVLLASRLLG